MPLHQVVIFKLWNYVFNQHYLFYWLYHLPSGSYLKPRPLSDVWNPDLTGIQELNNLLIRDSNFASSPQIQEITGSPLTTRSTRFTINGVEEQ